jgi:hypothetical protein
MRKKSYVFLIVLVSMTALYLILPRGETEEQTPLKDTRVKIAVTNPHYVSYSPWVDYETLTSLIEADIDRYCLEHNTHWRFDFTLFDSGAHPEVRVEQLYQDSYQYVIGLRSTNECDLWVHYQLEYGISDMLLVSTSSAMPTFNGRFEGHEFEYWVHTYPVFMNSRSSVVAKAPLCSMKSSWIPR